ADRDGRSAHAVGREQCRCDTTLACHEQADILTALGIGAEFLDARVRAACLETERGRDATVRNKSVTHGSCFLASHSWVVQQYLCAAGPRAARGEKPFRSGVT